MIYHAKKLSDVGTDHGFLPIKAVLTKKAEMAIAMDLRPGPLDRARTHVKEYGLEGKIELRLSDGIMALFPGEADVITICGMGGNTMMHILSRGLEKALKADSIILQPQSDIEELRRFLYLKGFTIIDENMIRENEKYYPIIKAIPSFSPLPDELSLSFGPMLLEKKNLILKDFILKESRTNKLILENLLNAEDNERNKEALQKQRRRHELLSSAALLFDIKD
jgi:tRNA (adenine22-N1)-methyltransferase